MAPSAADDALASGGEPQPGLLADLLLRVTACFLILWTPFFFLSSYRGHPVPVLSLVYSALLFAIPSVVIALAMSHRSGRRRVVLFALLVGLFLNIQLSWFDDLVAYIGFVVLALLFWPIRIHLPTVLTAVFGTILVSSMILPPSTPSATPSIEASEAGTDLPGEAEQSASTGLYLHLILDEFAGPAGIPLDFEGGPALRAELIRFFEARGFSLYRTSFSQQFASADSISDFLNFQASPRPDLNYHDKQPFVLARNAYFEWLGASFRALHVHQSTFMDFCSESPIALASCSTYRHDSTRWLRDAPLDPWAKMSVLLGLYANTSGFIESTGKSYRRARHSLAPRGISLPAVVEWSGILAPLNGASALDELQASVLAGPGNAAHFAHLLLPHYPYVFDAECRIHDRPLAWLNNTPRYISNNTPWERELRYREYAEQVRCTLARLDGFFTTLDDAGLLADATIIVQGDHGSRISKTGARTWNADSFDRKDFWDAYGALFAIRDPSFRPADLEAPMPISEILTEFTGHTGPASDVGSPPRLREPGLSAYLLGEDDEDRQWIAFPPDREHLDPRP